MLPLFLTLLVLLFLLSSSAQFSPALPQDKGKRTQLVLSCWASPDPKHEDKACERGTFISVIDGHSKENIEQDFLSWIGDDLRVIRISDINVEGEHDIGDKWFKRDLERHCSERCRYVIARKEGISTIPTIEEFDAQMEQALVNQKTDMEIHNVVTPSYPNGTTNFEPFPVAEKAYSFFGKLALRSNDQGKRRKHAAALDACKRFRSKVQNIFMKLRMTTSAVFELSGQFRLFTSPIEKNKDSKFSDPILASFIQTFLKKTVSSSSANRDLGQTSWRRQVYRWLAQDAAEVNEEMLDKAIARVYRALHSVHTISDAKQVNAMAKGVRARGVEKMIRRFGTFTLVLGAGGVIAIFPPLGLAAAIGVGAGSLKLAQQSLKLVKDLGYLTLRITQDQLKSNEAGRKKDSADVFGQTQNQLRWIKHMEHWAENWVEPDPLSILNDADVAMRVKNSLLCEELQHDETIQFPIDCNPVMGLHEAESVDAVETMDVVVEDDTTPLGTKPPISMHDEQLRAARTEFKGRFLATFIRFVLNDGGCDDVGFSDLADFTKEDAKEAGFVIGEKNNVDEETRQNAVNMAQKEHERLRKAWQQFCEAKSHFNGGQGKLNTGKNEFSRSRCANLAVQAAENKDNTKKFCTDLAKYKHTWSIKIKWSAARCEKKIASILDETDASDLTLKKNSLQQGR